MYNLVMEPLKSFNKSRFAKNARPKKDSHLHSPAHVLADELSKKLNDQKHFGFYLKMTMLYEHNFLRQLMGQILESKSVKTPGRLFAYLIKKHNEEMSKNDHD